MPPALAVAGSRPHAGYQGSFDTGHSSECLAGRHRIGTERHRRRSAPELRQLHPLAVGLRIERRRPFQEQLRQLKYYRKNETRNYIHDFNRLGRNSANFWTILSGTSFSRSSILGREPNSASGNSQSWPGLTSSAAAILVIIRGSGLR